LFGLFDIGRRDCYIFMCNIWVVEDLLFYWYKVLQKNIPLKWYGEGLIGYIVKSYR